MGIFVFFFLPDLCYTMGMVLLRQISVLVMHRSRLFAFFVTERSSGAVIMVCAGELHNGEMLMVRGNALLRHVWKCATCLSRGLFGAE